MKAALLPSQNENSGHGFQVWGIFNNLHYQRVEAKQVQNRWISVRGSIIHLVLMRLLRVETLINWVS